ncbi:ParB/Srx family N-terminal domain-containing protein [Mesorhizobium sp. KR9-304]|uniref:ParB/Srx family N-terminal domain-containing protein n=1 Tax=Mesorhizobium sp. KR9-304 TaxID=3156614 RepID=UPI0032B3856A
MQSYSPALEMVPVARLKPYSGNARTHSRKQVRQIADSIQRFGFTNPVLIGDDHEIIAGHGRVMAAKELGLAAVPTVKLAHLSPEERRAYVLADNKLALNAGWDTEILAIELQALIDIDFDVTLTGFSLAEIDLTLDHARRRPERLKTMLETSFPSCRRRSSRNSATCGCSAGIGCCAVTPDRRTMSDALWPARWPT